MVLRSQPQTREYTCARAHRHTPDTRWSHWITLNLCSLIWGPKVKGESGVSPQVTGLRAPLITCTLIPCPQALYGHTQAVTCLAASVTFNVLVSGSQDCMCILWDLDHLTHVARLPAHREGVSAVAISDVSVRLFFLNVCVLNMSNDSSR